MRPLRFFGSVREVTINRTAGTRFACFAMETGEAFPPVKDGETVDVGVGTLAVCSNGLEVENPKALKAHCRGCGRWTRPSPGRRRSTARRITATGGSG